ncbi:MAG: hypothetical protein J6X54_02165 [Treponema sp.]|nr:hypothetical protein [Treponema sp.]
MKKRLLISLMTLGLFATPLSAYQHGITLNGGAAISCIASPFLYEEIGYKFLADNNIGFTIGARATEDLFFPSDLKFLYISPYVELDLANYYLAGGITLSTGTISSDALAIPFIKTGCTFGNWEWGPGIGNIDIGIDLTATMLWSVIEQGDVGAAISGSLLSIFNFAHLYVGVTWFLPF